MGSNSLKGWIEVLIFAAAALVLSFLPTEMGGYYLAWAILPLVFISLRRGLLQGIFASALAGILVLFLKGGSSDFAENLVVHFGPIAFAGITGLFAKFTQRTLHNKRYPNAALNIVTASVIAAVLYAVWLLVDLISFRGADVPSGMSAFQYYLPTAAVSFLLSAGMTAAVLLLLAKFAPKLFIPRDTPFLSRKEKSRLLND